MLTVDDFFPGRTDLRLEDVVVRPTLVKGLVVSTAQAACCPRCGVASGRVHSRYRRLIADVPCLDRPVALRMVVRRFRCGQADCPQEVFCECILGLLGSHARTTERCRQVHQAHVRRQRRHCGAATAVSLP